MTIWNVQCFHCRALQVGVGVTASFFSCPCAPLARLVCFEVASDNLALLLCVPGAFVVQQA